MKRQIIFLIIISSFCLSGCFFKKATFDDTRFLMDTTVELKLHGSDREALQKASAEAMGVMQTIADETGRYHQGAANGLFALNKQAGSHPFAVGDHLFKLLNMLITQPYKELDFSLGPVIDVWQKHQQTKTVPQQEELTQALNKCGMQKVSLDAAIHTVRLTPGAKLDLGAVAKGYAVDCAYTSLKRNKAVNSALINAGGNIRVLGEKTAGNWKIGLQDPRDSNKLLGTIELKAGEALATSGDYQRYYEVGGTRYHHILDPTTGLPARNAISVTVLSTSALTTDFFSTLLFIMPRSAAQKLVEETPQISALIVYAPGDLYISPLFAKRFTKL